MNGNSFLGKALPHIIAVIVFLAISIFLYRPIIFEGKVMNQHDINMGVGASKEIKDYREKTGKEALWTNSMFSGMPAYLISLNWSGATIVQSAQKVLLLFLPRPIGENFLAFLTFYILLLTFGVRPWLAIGGAMAFGLSTFFVISIQAGHMWKIRAIAYMPLVLAGVRLVFTRKYLSGFILTAFALALELNASHLQITYYLFIMLMIYGISELYFEQKEKDRGLSKKVALLAIAGLLAVGTNLGKLWTTWEYGKYSIRGKSELTSTPAESKAGLDRDYAFQWSSGKWESMTLFIPHLYGGASGVYAGKDSELGKILKNANRPRNEIKQAEAAYLGYWGDQPGTAGPAYAGAVIIFLFVLSLFFIDKKDKYWMLTIIILSVMLSWGKNFPVFNNLMFDLFPGYNKFRAVTMVIILALTLIPLMGFLGLEKLIETGWTKDVQKKVFIATGITIGTALLALLVTDPPYPEGMQNVLANAIHSDRKDVIRSDVFRSIFYVVAAFGALFFYKRKTIGITTFSIIIGALVLLDLSLVDSRYLNDAVYVKKSAPTIFVKTPADEKILQDKSLGYRVLNLQNPFNEARTSYYHKSIGGYHGAKIRRYQDVISRHLTKEIQQIMTDRGLNAENTKVLSMLNARYVMAGMQAESVLKNPYANGTAWFVENIEKVNSPDEEIEKIGTVNLDRTAVLDVSKFRVGNIQADSAAQVRMTSYEPNHLIYEAETSAPSLAVFSEIYYPKGWTATVDGKEVNILRVNYLLRALELSPGKHTIEFVFAPRSYYLGNTIMWISSILLIIVLGYGIFIILKQNEATDPEEA